ncbi:hypothetical protein BVRB_032580, partial [Beta vulgaris subsp. vulgaris]
FENIGTKNQSSPENRPIAGFAKLYGDGDNLQMVKRHGDLICPIEDYEFGKKRSNMADRLCTVEDYRRRHKIYKSAKKEAMALRRQPFPSMNRFFGGDIKRSLTLLVMFFATSIALAITSQQFPKGSFQHELCLQTGGISLLCAMFVSAFDFFWMIGTIVTLFLTTNIHADVATPAARP